MPVIKAGCCEVRNVSVMNIFVAREATCCHKQQVAKYVSLLPLRSNTKFLTQRSGEKGYMFLFLHAHMHALLRGFANA